MNFNRCLTIFSFLLVVLICIGAVTATENVNINEDNFTDVSSCLKLDDIDELSTNENTWDLNENLTVGSDDVLSQAKTIVVEEVEKNHNEMNNPTIQNAIDDANPGDTIVIKGSSYVHCHFKIYKQLTIVSDVGTTMEPCGKSDGSGFAGIFYVAPEASGTVIDGFTLNNAYNVQDADDYGILVRGTSDVIVRNCVVTNNGVSDAIRVENAKNTLVENVTLFNANNGIRIRNCENTIVKKSISCKSNNGIIIIDSNNTKIISNNLSNNAIAGISYSGNGHDLTVMDNNITDNGDGIRLTSTNQINVLSNYIAFNKNNGVYVDYNVTKLEIKGNFFNQNIRWDVFNDFHVKNMKDRGHEKEIVTNNYMINYGFGSGDMDRPVWTQMYEYKPGTSYADYRYDEASDSFVYVGDGNGDYYGHQEVMFLGYVFDINNFLSCPNIYVAPNVIWSKYSSSQLNLELTLSNITQVKKGVYSISIVDSKGNVVSDLSSVPITFYLNKADNSASPKEGDIYKTIMMRNGTATVRFEEGFNESGNVITAVAPTPGSNIDSKVSRTFNVDDGDIPSASVSTKIYSSNSYMAPGLAEYYKVTLKDELGFVLANQAVTFTVNGNKYNRQTDKNGVASVLLKFSSQKTYNINIRFAGSDEYNPVSKTNKIIVKKSSKTAKITAPSMTIPPKTSKTYTVTLNDANGKGIANQKLTIKINGKTYTKKTNKNGKASVKVKFTALKTYKVSVSYKATGIYKKASANGKIKVAKTATKITAPSVTILPKQSKTYTITLKNSAGKALSKQKVTIKVNGKTYTKKTNSNGKASVNVKFSAEKKYSVVVNYKGTGIYKPSKATGKITVSKIATKLVSYDRTFATDSYNGYTITLKDNSGKVLTAQKLTCSVNGKSYSAKTNTNGQIKINVPNNSGKIIIKYAGNSKYKAVSKTNKITFVNRSNISFVDKALQNSEIQDILKNAKIGSDVEFLGDSYSDIVLNVDKSLNIYSSCNSILIAKSNGPVFVISADDVNVSGFSIIGNSNDAIVVKNAKNVNITDNLISNKLDKSKIENYLSGEVMLPGYGVNILNSDNVSVSKNTIEAFESGIFAQDSSFLVVDNNTLRENNYGIKYGYGVANTQVINNEITECIGLYIMTVPEGPSGYGIFLNNSAVNVTINHNHIYYNHMGISLDAKNSTGIVITQNTITDNVLEGIRFNAPYDLALNAVEPLVTDNAIYRNARGPSMMILGELSANPEGIYGGGLLNPEERLKLDANWYGTNKLVTWDYDTGIVGYGTMCPRISTTEIAFNNITYNNGSYEVVFYKNGVKASNLPEFDLFATLNWGSSNAVEVNFNVVDGVGSFSFNPENYNADNNTVSITVASLINSTTRVPKIIYSYDI